MISTAFLEDLEELVVNLGLVTLTDRLDHEFAQRLAVELQLLSTSNGVVTPSWISAERGQERPGELQAAVAARHVRNASSLKTRSVRRDVR